jgi:hypothetical protein
MKNILDVYISNRFSDLRMHHVAHPLLHAAAAGKMPDFSAAAAFHHQQKLSVRGKKQDQSAHIFAALIVIATCPYCTFAPLEKHTKIKLLMAVIITTCFIYMSRRNRA